MSHTPGPWEASFENPVTDIKATGFLEVIDDANGTLAFVNCESMPPSKEDLANARLIASAPDLLEALKEVLKGMEAAYTEGCNEVPPNIEWFDYSSVTQAYTALAKATGGNHVQKS